MKKTFSLLGLFFVGLMLLANPSTGILAASDTELVVAAEPTTTISGDPPNEDTEEDLIVEMGDSTTTTEPSATTSTETTTTTEATPTSGLDEGESFTVAGSVEDSRFGDFQVEVTFLDGAIVDVEALQLPTDGKSSSINNSAVPQYEEAIIEAQSADIDVISGATITWENYTASVQSALDEVGV